MKQALATCLLFTGLLCYLALQITGGIDWAYVKCIYTGSCMLFFSFLVWDFRKGPAALFIAFSSLSVFFLIATLTNLGYIKEPHLSPFIFIGLNFVLLLTRIKK